MTTVSLISLGCPKNTVDSETLLRALRASGIAVVENPEEADILAVNTLLSATATNSAVRCPK
jgi:ribosomal protein S12 methylthiotransferase